MPGSALRSILLGMGMLSDRLGGAGARRPGSEPGGRSGRPLLRGSSPNNMRCASLSPGILIAFCIDMQFSVHVQMLLKTCCSSRYEIFLLHNVWAPCSEAPHEYLEEPTSPMRRPNVDVALRVPSPHHVTSVQVAVMLFLEAQP